MDRSVALVVFFSFLVQFLLLLGTNRLLGFPGSPWRCAAGALLGGVWSGASLIPRLFFLGSWYWHPVSLGLMCMLSFGLDTDSWKRWALFFLLSLGTEAVTVCMGRGDWLSLALGLLLAWGLSCFSLGEGRQIKIPVTLTHGGRSMNLTALRDTGNTLRDPVSGDPVLVISPEAAMQLTGLTKQQLCKPLETLTQRPIPGLRLIPYRAVGQGNGMLLGARLQDVRSRGRVLRTVVAFAPEGLDAEDGYQALTGGYV